MHRACRADLMKPPSGEKTWAQGLRAKRGHKGPTFSNARRLNLTLFLSSNDSDLLSFAIDQNMDAHIHTSVVARLLFPPLANLLLAQDHGNLFTRPGWIIILTL